MLNNPTLEEEEKNEESQVENQTLNSTEDTPTPGVETLISSSEKKKDEIFMESQTEMVVVEKKGFDGNGNGSEENGKRSLSRERKKSKYLSPPYTNPEDNLKMLPKKSHLGDVIIKDQISWSPPILNCSSKTFKNASSAEMFYEFITAAMDTMYLKGNPSSRLIKGFFTTYRSSLYLEGFNYKRFEEFMADQRDIKGEILDDNKPSLVDEDIPEVTEESGFNDKTESKIIELDDKVDPNGNKDDTMLEAPKSSEPTKKNKRKYEKKVQDLNSEPTRIKRKYEKKSVDPNGKPKQTKKKDEKILQNSAEATSVASNHLPQTTEQDKNSPQLVPTPTELKEDETPANQTTTRVPVEKVSSILVVKERLQMMTSMLEKSGNELVPEVKAKLELEIKSLLEKVNTQED